MARGWLYLIAAAIAVLALFGAYRHGVSVTASAYEAKMAKQEAANANALNGALIAQAEQSKANLNAALAIERQRLVREAITQDFFNSLSEQATNYVNQNPAVRACGLDADGLRIWREANSGSGAKRSPASRP